MLILLNNYVIWVSLMRAVVKPFILLIMMVCTLRPTVVKLCPIIIVIYDSVFLTLGYFRLLGIEAAMSWIMDHMNDSGL